MPDDTRATLAGYKWLRDSFEDDEAVQRIVKVGELMIIADNLGASMAQIALAWTLKNPNVSTTITGASKPQQIIENMKAIDLVPKLTSEIIEKIEKILDNKTAKPQSFR